MYSGSLGTSIGDFPIALSIADQARNFSFAAAKLREMAETRALRFGGREILAAQIFALNQKMRLRDAGGVELFQMNGRSQMRERGRTRFRLPVELI